MDTGEAGAAGGPPIRRVGGQTLCCSVHMSCPSPPWGLLLWGLVLGDIPVPLAPHAQHWQG